VLTLPLALQSAPLPVHGMVLVQQCGLLPQVVLQGRQFPVSADNVTLDAATCVGGTTCTITVNTNFNITALTMGACTASTTGCILDFSINNNNVTLTGGLFDVSGTGTRH